MNRRLGKETMSPSFIKNLKLIAKIIKFATIIGGSELEYLSE